MNRRLSYLTFLLITYSCANMAMQEVQRQVASKNYEGAIIYLGKHLDENPGDADAWFVLGETYAKIKNYRQMNIAFKQSFDLSLKYLNEIESIKEKYFNTYLEDIEEKISIYKKLVYKTTPGAQKLALEITDLINVASEIIPNDSRIPKFMDSGTPHEEKRISNTKLQKLKNSYLAILDFAGNNITPGTASAITNRFFHEIFQKNFYILLERDKTKAILEEQSFQISGCTSTECLIEAGKLLNVELMLGGTVSKVENFYMIDIRLIDVESGEILMTAKEDVSGSFEDLIKIGLPKIVEKLVLSAK